MKPTTTFFKVVIPAIIICVFLNQCKSPAPEAETEVTTETEMTDTVAVIPDAPEASKPDDVKSDITPLTVTVTNLKSPDAPVEISIYSTPKSFPDKDGQLKKYRFNPINGKLVATLDEIPYGEFAIALYQDLNSSGEIDKNGIGIPTEPYAFSNNFKPVFKKPSFDNCKFDYTAQATNINIALLK